MTYEITVKVTDGEKTIEIPWEDVKNDFIDFVLEKGDPEIHESFAKVFAVVESRIRCVFLDRYMEYLIQ